jgi:hypothetical protein
LVTKLVNRLPGVAKDHADTGTVDAATLRAFAESLPLARLSTLSPKPFASAADVYAMLTLPLEKIP